MDSVHVPLSPRIEVRRAEQIIVISTRFVLPDRERASAMPICYYYYSLI
jgi:hypothetical protein